jgi:hypothetical protein
MDEDKKDDRPAAETGSAAASNKGAPGATASKAERWSVRVALMAGANPETLFAESGSKFKVSLSQVLLTSLVTLAASQQVLALEVLGSRLQICNLQYK